MSILCCQENLKNNRIFAKKIWTWVWSPPLNNVKKNCTIGKGRLPLFPQEGQQPDLHGGVDSLGGSRNGPLSTAAAQPWLAGLQGLGRRDDVHNAHLPLSNWRCFGILHGAALVHCRLAISPHTGAEGAVMVPRYLFTTRTVERVVMKNFFQRA